ncbi:MAG: hypothetical protein CL398_12725 [Acidiferrobacteraceae bacterium]|nr:hypothetical protein [Acidiferrobacteraceae bacterium]
MLIDSTITLDVEKALGTVQNHLYGANLEHYAQSIYGGNWSEMLQDRKFSGQDNMFIGLQEGLNHEYPGFGVVRPWLPINPNPAHVRFVHDNTTYYSGRQSQRVVIERDDELPHGIFQGDLFLQKGKKYDLTLVLRGPNKCVEVQLDGVVWVIQNIPADWKTFKTTVVAPRDNCASELSITISGVGSIWIGSASLMPSDNIKGHRPDVIQAISEWGPTFLRWPGGNFVSAYHWMDGIGPRDKRPTRLDPAFSLLESNDVGTDEFMELCQLLDTEPVLTVNMGNGTPSEAAAWVEYCNGSADTKYGSMRKENGHPNPHNVRTWFVGNELFGNWQVGHIDPETYAQKYVEFAEAMRAVDPDLYLIGVGVPISLYGRWNELVVKSCGTMLNALSVHYYSIRTEMMKSAPNKGDVCQAKTVCSIEVESMLSDTIQIIDEAADGREIPIAFDEWNTYVDAKGPDFIGTYDLSDAIYLGGLMNAVLRLSNRIHLSCIYNLINAMAPYRVAPTYQWELQTDGGPENTYWLGSTANSDVAPMTWKMPQALVLELITQYRGTVAISCEVETSTFSSIATGTLPAYKEVPTIDAGATYNPTDKIIYLSIVNRSLENSMLISLKGINRISESAIYIVTGESPDATNTAENPHNVRTTKHKWPIDSSTFSIPRHSFAMIVISV